jgi:hypothetical protein
MTPARDPKQEFLDRAAFPHPSQDLISRGTARGPASKTVGKQAWNFVNVVTLVVRPNRISHFPISVFLFCPSLRIAPHTKNHTCFPTVPVLV